MEWILFLPGLCILRLFEIKVRSDRGNPWKVKGLNLKVDFGFIFVKDHKRLYFFVVM